MSRYFEEVLSPFRKFPDLEIQMPVRADRGSAGYDFYSNETVEILPNEAYSFVTDLKCKMGDNEVLMLYIRSSLGINKGLYLTCGTGVIDSTFYGNPTNDGNIVIPIVNHSNEMVTITKGDRIAQGVFIKYLITDTDEPLHDSRIGGIGSSNR